MTRFPEIIKVTLLGTAANLLLTVFKFVAGIVGHSAAMTADAVHSLSDLLTDAVVLVFVRISGKPEALAAVAVGIGWKGVESLLFWYHGGTLAEPGMLALWAAVASVVLKEAVYQYTIRRGKALNSTALEANAWHHRSDALSSLGTMVGIGGAILLGDRWTVLDPLAGLVVSLFILRVAWKLLKGGFDELMEASLPDEVEKEILEIVTSFPEVCDPHHLRTRRIGSRYAIELHIRMDGSMSLAESHARTCEIEQALKNRFGEKTHITLHVEPTK